MSHQLRSEDIKKAVAHIKKALQSTDTRQMVGVMYCSHCEVGHWIHEPLPEGCTLLDDISTAQPK